MIGQSIGRYHILEQIGEGGMAIVYKAFDTHTESEVAVKVIRTEKFTPESLGRALKRFEREARALAHLTHSNIVKVTDYGQHDNQPYLVMPYVPEGTLKARLQSGQLQWQQAAQLLLPIARALVFAHQQGMIHRDVKPANILITSAGDPLLTDFGIAKILEYEETVDLTATAMTVGTPEYMAPEQASSKTIDLRVDVYALGIVYYEMITGRRPFQADTPLAVIIKHSTDPLPRPGKFVQGLPKRVEQVLFKALAKQPEHRYPTMSEFAAALEQLAAGNLPKTVGIPGQGIGLNRNLIIGGSLVIGVVLILGMVFGLRGLFTDSSQDAAMVPQDASSTTTLASNQPVEIDKVSTQTLVPSLTPSITIQPSSTATVTQSPTATLTSSPKPTATATNTTSPAEDVGLVIIPAGEFTMGSNSDEPYFWGAEASRHTVYLDDFSIYRTEVTNSMYSACVVEKACPRPVQSYSRSHPDYYTNPAYADYPVIYVTYTGALAYCRWAGARLPTEAEWEKAARGTDGRLFPWGNSSLSQNLANFCDIGCPNPTSGEVESAFDDGYHDTAPVGSFPAGASPYGVLDMAGNVLEWVSDWYSAGYYSQSPYENPLGPGSGSKHPIRGGSWYSGRAGLRTSARASLSPERTYDTLGFRCVVSP